MSTITIFIDTHRVISTVRRNLVIFIPILVCYCEIGNGVGEFRF